MDIRRALIVDDSKLVCFQLSKILKDKGIASQAVNSGEEAVAYLAKNPLPDVVFIDIMMPGMDGYQTTEAIRAQAALAHLPIIMCSSNDSDEDRAQAKQRGANGFLPKPPTAEQITKTFASLIPPPKKSDQPPVVQTTTPPPGEESELTARIKREAVVAAEQTMQSRGEELMRRFAGELTKELTEKATQSITALIESEVFRQSLHRELQSAAEKMVGQSLRNIIEASARATAEQILARMNIKPPTN